MPTKGLIRIGCVLLVATLNVRAQREGLQPSMADLLRYTGVENPSPEDVARMTELWSRAQEPGLAHEERRLAFRDMYLLYSKLHGRDLTERPKVFDRLTQFVVSTFEGGGRMDLTLPEPRGEPTGTYLHVATRGQGEAPLLLISDVGTDGRKVYGSFAERQQNAYRMYIVTLPYAGEARPLPWPEKLDYVGHPWLNEIERELLALLDRPEMKGITVVGTQAGGYFAARLALLRPKQVRCVVLVNALAHTSLRSPSDPDAPATFAQRMAQVKSVAPAPQLVPLAPVPPPDELRRLIADPASTHPTARNWMAFAVKDSAVSRAWTFEDLTAGFLVPSLEYSWELTSTDLTNQMKDLVVPMLALSSWHDEASPAPNVPNISQWEEIKLLYPAIPLTVVAFDDTRSYLSEDAPAEFDRAIADFLAGRPVRGKIGHSLPRSIPHASAMQAVGGGEVEIAYGRPAVKGRKVWGELVPYERVWSAGANEATRFTFNRDVKIEGVALSAGAYTFFAIPRETEWTLIFNRVPRQCGAFDYNPEFDALRFRVKPEDTPHEEYLRYTIEPATSSSCVVTLAWDKHAVRFRIEAVL